MREGPAKEGLAGLSWFGSVSGSGFAWVLVIDGFVKNAAFYAFTKHNCIQPRKWGGFKGKALDTRGRVYGGENYRLPAMASWLRLTAIWKAV